MRNGWQVIGCGNPDRGDDAAGLLVAKRLGELGIDATEESGEASSLIESWRDEDAVIVVDAVITGASPGTINFWDLSDSIRLPTTATSTHGFGVAQAIELARALDCLPRQLFIYGIEGSRFEIGTPPSVEIMAAVERLAQELTQFIRQADDPNIEATA